jgi:hypothetical protein
MTYEWNEGKHEESEFPSFHKSNNKTSDKGSCELQDGSYFLSDSFLNYEGVTVIIVMRNFEERITHFAILEVSFPVPTKSKKAMS